MFDVRNRARTELLKLLLRFFFSESRVVRIHRQPVRHLRAFDARDGVCQAKTSDPAPGCAPGTVPRLQSTLSGKCYVIDGDTIQIGTVRLRLAGIDAPELEHPWGKKAKWELVRLCKGQIITAKIEPDISYDRVVATCFLPDGRDLSAEMVRSGHALDWTKFSGGKYAHLEPSDARKKHWKAAARQRGQMHIFNK